MEEGKWYLIASPFFWTTVGRFVRNIDLHDMEIADAIYFTRTGATFDILCTKGPQGNTQYHGSFPTLIVPRQGLKFTYAGPKPWVKK